MDNENYNILEDGRVWSKYSNKSVGHLSKDNGYIRCTIEKKSYMVHRLVWLKFKGEIPEHLEIDHINDDRSDNRLVNLQLLTSAENSAKRMKFLSNTSGYTGVSLEKSLNRYKAQFQSKEYNNGKLKYLGRFNTPEEAAIVRDNFIIKNGFKHHRLNFPNCMLDPEILKRLEKIQSPSKSSPKSSKFTGVSLHKKSGKYEAYIQSKDFNNDKRMHLGMFKTQEEAARARDDFIKKNNLKHRLNFPQ